MSSVLQQKEYLEEIARYADCDDISWEKLRGKSLFISGATGMVASSFIDVLMYRNRVFGNDIKIIGLSRNEARARERFGDYFSDEKHFTYIARDVVTPLARTDIHADYVIHAASNTHPRAYATDPIGTITANVDGTKNLLELCKNCGCERFVFLSSVEIYGENRGDVEKFDEAYMGYIDCNTLRGGYPESKRLGEALCHAYNASYGVDFVIPRLSRIYGPTLLDSDTKAISQFIHKAVEREDIVLKSVGTQVFSYTYVMDAVMGILTVMLQGESKGAYNIADKESDSSLRALAGILAQIAETNLVFDLPDAVELAGYSTATKAMLDSSKLEALGWKAYTHMEEGLLKTIGILQSKKEQ